MVKPLRFWVTWVNSIISLSLNLFIEYLRAGGGWWVSGRLEWKCRGGSGRQCAWCLRADCGPGWGSPADPCSPGGTSVFSTILCTS